MNNLNNRNLSPSFKGLEKYNIDELFGNLPTPAYVLDEAMLKRNGEILKGVQDRTGCKILLAQKAFSNFNMYGILGKYLAGTEASGLYEARLGAEEMPDGEVHVFCGAYKDDEFEELLKYADHIVFNSVNQLAKFGKRAKAAGKSIGLRVNPECSTQEGHEIYDPCAPGSRLGVTKVQWDENMTEELINSLDGIHFHTLCEQGAEPLEVTLKVVEEKFGSFLYNLNWINFGGGHHITKDDYNIDLLEQLIKRVQEEYKVQVYLEPGEACALNAGYLITEVLDITKNGEVTNVIFDASAACHMPDVIEMPYMPPIYGAYIAEDLEDDFGLDNKHLVSNKRENKYCLGGPTCLSGDVIGNYCFEGVIKIGNRVIFGDMAIYTTCKNNTFNGMPLPSIYSLKEDGVLLKLAQFSYEDFKYRLGK
ncbi:MAG: carboxynorspermidine decarboxylase [Lachnospiraceae bacterium]|nr:carboxynorspermidine decarboxylase [Lachnospiraceae bacterium]